MNFLKVHLNFKICKENDWFQKQSTLQSFRKNRSIFHIFRPTKMSKCLISTLVGRYVRFMQTNLPFITLCSMLGLVGTLKSWVLVRFLSQNYVHQSNESGILIWQRHISAVFSHEEKWCNLMDGIMKCLWIRSSDICT